MSWSRLYAPARAGHRLGGTVGRGFSTFRAVWLEPRETKDDKFILHALMDSPGCTGAYRFATRPGQPLNTPVEGTIVPRVDMTHVGIAPLTSVFQFDETNRDAVSDFRPAVHVSDGLLILKGAGEAIWRPLANPRALQISAFRDENPRRFGLMQRSRKFSDYAGLFAL